MSDIRNFHRIYRIVRNILFTTLVLFIGGTFLFVGIFQIPAVQSWAAIQAVKYLSNKLDTRVEIENINLNIFDHFIIDGVYVEDRNTDTLIYVENLNIEIRNINPFTQSFRLRSIEITNARINLYRYSPDSIFNYQFVLDALGSKNKSESKQKSFPDISLKKISLEKIHYTMFDDVEFVSSEMFLHKGEILANKVDLEAQIIGIESIILEGARFGLISLQDNTSENSDEEISEENYDYVSLGLKNWLIEAIQFQLIDCEFQYRNENKNSQTAAMNFNDLHVTDIQLDFEDVIASGDTISTFINQLALKEKCGFQLNNLSGSTLFSGNEITINSFILETPNSKISNKISLTYNTLNDFNRIYDDIRFQAEFTETYVDVKDIAYFAPQLNKYEMRLLLNSNVSGPISNLKIRNLNANINGAIAMVGQANLKGLPKTSELFIDADFMPLNVRTAGLQKMNIKLPPNMLEMGDVLFAGNFTGFIYDFVVFGDIHSNAGNARADLNFKYLKESKNALYSGNVIAGGLNLGKLSGNNRLGTISTNASFKGSGLNLKDLNAQINAEISQFELNGYNYQNIDVDGTFSDNYFEGYLTVADSNLKIDFTGIIDLKSEVHTYNFKATDVYANLLAMHLYSKPFEINTNLDIALTGNNLNSITGKIIIDETAIKTPVGIENISTLTATSVMAGNKRIIDVQSDYLNLKLEGIFNLISIDKSLKNLADYFIYGEQPLVVKAVGDQNLDFDLSVGDVSHLAHTIFPAIDSLKNIKLSGSLNTAEYALFARLQLQNIKIQGRALRNLALEINSDKDTLAFYTRVREIGITPDYNIPKTILEGTFANRKIDYNLKMGGDTDPERLNLNANVQLADSLITMNVLPSEIYVNNAKWNIEPNNSLIYNYKTIYADNFTLRNEGRSVSLSNQYDEKVGNLLKLEIANFSIEDLATLAGYESDVFVGTLNAKVNIGGDFKEPDIIALATIDNFKIYDQLIGNVNATASMIHPNPNIQFNVVLRGSNSMRGYGYYHLGEIDSINFVADISKVPLKVVEPFTQGLFSEFEGDMYGNLTIKGPVEKPEMQGVIEMKNGGLKFDYLGVKYDFDFQKIELSPDNIYLTLNKIKDKYGNEGFIGGNIKHDYFTNWYFDDFKFQSDYILIMETTAQENPDFWGYAIGKTDVSINGPLENLMVNVNATPARYENKLSTVSIPAYGSGNVKRNEFIEFINLRDTATTIIVEKTTSPGQLVTISMFMDINPDAEVMILLSSSGTDIIRGRGTGSLNIIANSKGKVEISGLLKINEGSYDFSFEGLTTKSFFVKEGGTILFDQDPYKAKLDLVAVYQATRVSKYNLISDMTLTSQQIEEANENITVDVLIKITGPLESPEIGFDIKVPEESSGSLTEFDTRLNEVKADPNELNKQVFGLLMLNQFLPKEFGAATAIGASISNSMTDFITNQLSNYFSDWISEIFPNAEIDIGYRKVASGEDQSTYDKSELELGIKQKLFDNALTVTIGGVYSYENSNPNTSTGALAGDFEVEYKITADGRIRVKAFRTSEYNVISAKNDVKTGIGLVYSKEFNSFSELFSKSEEKE